VTVGSLADDDQYDVIRSFDVFPAGRPHRRGPWRTAPSG
jgi:hypothetical protein